MFKKISIIFIVLFLVFGFVTTVNAQENVIKIGGSQNADGGEISGSINNFYKTSIVLGGIAAVLVIIGGGIMYSVSGAIDKKNKGKEIIMSAIWGLVLLLGAYVVLNTINPELTSLEDPAGVEGIQSFSEGDLNMTGFSCAENPGVEKCEEGENPERNNDGSITCCVESNQVCNSEILRNCPVSGQEFVVGESENNNGPYCVDDETGELVENVEAKCFSQGAYYTYDCGEEISTEDGYKAVCDNGQPSCNADGEIYCPALENETINLVSCGDCSDQWEELESVTVEPGTVYYKAPYYPENGNPSIIGGEDGVKCVIFAYKSPAGGENWIYGDRDGLSTCQ